MGKIMFIDMDGTLIEDNKEIHPKNKEMMKVWQNKGHKIVLCTGRNVMECQVALKQFDFPYDYLVLNNGGHILNKEKTLYERTISHDVGCSILDITTQFHGLWSFYCDGKETYGYLNSKTYDHSGNGNMEIDSQFMDLYHKARDFQIIWFHQDNQQMDNTLYILDYIRKHFSNEIEAHLNLHYVDLVPCGCSKGEGVKRLLSLIDIEVDKSFAIGDSYNDVSMFKAVDSSATFVYADSYVKNRANEIVNFVYEYIIKSLGE